MNNKASPIDVKSDENDCIDVGFVRSLFEKPCENISWVMNDALLSVLIHRHNVLELEMKRSGKK